MCELFYADNLDYVDNSESDLQLIIDQFSTKCDAFDLTINKDV